MVDFDQTLLPRLSKYLTSDLLDQIPENAALSQATQRLNSLYKTIGSFLPSYITEDEALLMQDYANLNPGTFMFADVSGFTALSEQLLEKAGADGIEILTRIFNDYFATMLEILAKSEGSLLKFAGDALLTFFPAQAGQDELPKAVKTGLRMQRAMQERFQPIQTPELKKIIGEHQLELTMSIGIAQGQLFESLVGNLAQRDHMIMGRLPGEADAAEEAGLRDEVIIPAAIQARYQDQFATRPLADGFYQVIDNFGDELGDYEFSMPQRRRAKSAFLFSFNEADLLQDLETELTRVETIARYVSSEVVNKLVVTGGKIESENRLATVIFVHFTGFAELLDHWGSEKLGVIAVILNRYYSLMQRVISANGGVLTRSDPYKLGSKLLITFGAPVAHPDDPERAVTTALEMMRQVNTLNERLQTEFPDSPLHPFIRQRIGITQGNVYAGEVGWRQRREYTVMGDDVNLAARLMSRAEFGQILISERVWERINPYFETTSLERFNVKGKHKSIQAYSVQSSRPNRAHSTSDTPFVGREVTLLSIQKTLQEVMQNASLQAIALHGEPGVGKTRIGTEISLSAQNLGYKVAWAVSRTQNSRKATWGTLIRELLDLNTKQSNAEKDEQLAAQLEQLNLSELKDELSDLILDAPENKTETIREKQRDTSKIRQDLFLKLAGDETLAMQKDSLATFRNQIKKRLNKSTAQPLPYWNELEMRLSLTEAIKRFLTVYSQQQPILLIIDDIHKENQRAINILKRIIEDLQNARVAILVISETPLALPQEARKLAISDLPYQEAILLVARLLAAPEIGGKLRSFIWERSNGRPLYIESLIQNLSEDGHILKQEGQAELHPAADTDALPDDIRGLVISRIDRLPADSKELVRAAAVLGDTFNLDELAYLTDATPAESSGHINNLTALQLFEQLEAERETNTLRFKHGVTQHAVYEELTLSQRQRMHLRAADFYKNAPKTEQNTLRVVNHLMRAENRVMALQELLKAAQEAEAEQNIELALELHTQRLEISPDDEAIKDEIARLRNPESAT